MLVYFIVLGRWMLPRNDFTKEALSELLIDYLGMASDIMELFALFDEDAVRGNRTASLAILSVWTAILADREAKRTAKLNSKGLCFPKHCGQFYLIRLGLNVALTH